MPARFSAIKRAVEALGYSVEPPNGGSHWKVRTKSGCYPIPAHNGLKEEIPDVYIRGLCRFIKVDFEYFRRRL